jgi:hypothetical protein
VQVLDHAIAFARQGGVQHVTAVDSALWLIQVDSNELPLNGSANENAAVLSDLSLFSSADVEKFQRELVYLPMRQVKAATKKRPARGVTSIPYYLNPSFLVVQKEFRDFALGHRRWGSVGLGEGDYSWQDLIAAATEFRESSPKWKDHIIFDFPISPSENLNCLFLEVLSSLSGGQLNEDNFPSSFGPDSPLLQDENLLVSTMLILRRLAGESYEKYYYSGVKQAQESGPVDKATDVVKRAPSTVYGTKEAIIWRHWYSTFRQMAAELGSGKGQLNPGLSLLRLPGKVWTSGDWHLAILEGSVGVRSGIEIIRDKFVNRPTGILLMTKGVGLPPFKDFYTDESDLLLTGVAPRWFSSYVEGHGVIYRSMLKDYKKIAPLLRYYLASTIREREEAGHDLAKKIRGNFLSMHNKITRLISLTDEAPAPEK